MNLTMNNIPTPDYGNIQEYFDAIHPELYKQFGKDIDLKVKPSSEISKELVPWTEDTYNAYCSYLLDLTMSDDIHLLAVENILKHVDAHMHWIG